MSKADPKAWKGHAFGLAAMLAPAAMQFGLFAFLARTLGVEQYGLYIALLSWSPLCFELVGWGAGEYLIKQSAQGRGAYAAAYGHMQAVLWLTLPLAVICYVLLALGTTGLRIDLSIVVAIGFAEFAGMRMMVNAEQACIAQARLGPANWVRSVQVLPRALGVILSFLVLKQQTFTSFALGGSLGMLAGGLIVSLALRQRPSRQLGLSTSALFQGTWFTGTQLVRAGQHNIDRVVLAPLVDPMTLGLYSAAQRFIQMGLLPVQSVLRLKYRGFFEAGAGGLRAALRYGWSVLPLTFLAAATASIALLAAARLLPLLLGAEFEQSANYLLYLAPILPLFALNSVLSDTLSGAGYLALRLVLTAAGVAVQALMFCLFHSGNQIVLASYAGVGLSCLLTAASIGLLLRAERRSAVALT